MELLKLSSNVNECQPLLTGRVPHSLQRLPAITAIDLSRNALSGTLPTHLLTSPHLLDVSVRGNALTGALPTATLVGRCRSTASIPVFKSPVVSVLGV